MKYLTGSIIFLNWVRRDWFFSFSLLLSPSKQYFHQKLNASLYNRMPLTSCHYLSHDKMNKFFIDLPHFHSKTLVTFYCTRSRSCPDEKRKQFTNVYIDICLFSKESRIYVLWYFSKKNIKNKNSQNNDFRLVSNIWHTFRSTKQGARNSGLTTQVTTTTAKAKGMEFFIKTFLIFRFHKIKSHQFLRIHTNITTRLTQLPLMATGDMMMGNPNKRRHLSSFNKVTNVTFVTR